MPPSESDFDDESTERDSLYTLSESLAEALFVDRAGQRFATLSESYFLPYNNTTRVVAEYAEIASKLITGGDVSWEPEECAGTFEGLMRGRKGGGRVLDLGCGVEGHWVLAWAEKYPCAQEIVGMDIVPVVPKVAYVPSNIIWETWDVTVSIPYPAMYFDVIHARGLFPYIPDYRKLVAEAGRCLAPGGVLLLAEPDHDLHTKDGKTASWFALTEARSCPHLGSSCPRVENVYPLMKHIVEMSFGSDLKDRFDAVYEKVWNFHISSGGEDLSTPAGVVSSYFKKIMLGIWTAEVLRSDGSVAVSEILRKELAKIAADKEGGYDQACKIIWARKAGTRRVDP